MAFLGGIIGWNISALAFEVTLPHSAVDLMIALRW